MAPSYLQKLARAFSLVELLITISAVGLVVFFLVLMPLASSAKKHMGPDCTSNLMEIGLAYRIWADDHGGKFPNEVPMASGGTMEIFSRNSPFQNQIFLNFLAMSNELATPVILHCMSDSINPIATNFFKGFNNQNVSYFVNLDADRTHAAMPLAGDDNFQINETAVNRGRLQIPSDHSLKWSITRHRFNGNVLYSDDSVREMSNLEVPRLLRDAGFPHCRIIVP